MEIEHINEIFSLEGEDFIVEAYRNLLSRDPDEHGLAYYLGCLSLGYGKIGVVIQLAESEECRSVNKIKGLKKLIKNERRASHWFFGMLSRHQRIERRENSALHLFNNFNQSNLSNKKLQLQLQLKLMEKILLKDDNTEVSNLELFNIIVHSVTESAAFEMKMIENKDVESNNNLNDHAGNFISEEALNSIKKLIKSGDNKS